MSQHVYILLLEMGGVRSIHFCRTTLQCLPLLDEGLGPSRMHLSAGAQRLHVFEFVLQEVNLLLGQLCGALSILALGVAVGILEN